MIINQIIFGILLYFLFSFSENLVHRYLMHGDRNKYTGSLNHWTHHEHTLDDMNLKNSDGYNSSVNKYLGLYLLWCNTIMIFIVGLIEGFALYFILKYLCKMNIVWWSVFIWVILFSIYQSSFWNTIHPDIHNIKYNLSWKEGIPGWSGYKIIFTGGLYDWFKRNHELHHLRKGNRKGNFNVTLPGADFIIGTMYSSESD